MSAKESHGAKGLAAAILIDIVGFATYQIPLLGEFGDIIWAPISAYLIYKFFNNKTAATIGFIEEILPFTDFIPTATFAWFMAHFEIGNSNSHKTTNTKESLDPNKEVFVDSETL